MISHRLVFNTKYKYPRVSILKGYSRRIVIVKSIYMYMAERIFFKFPSRRAELIWNSEATLTNIPHERNDQEVVTRRYRSRARDPVRNKKKRPSPRQSKRSTNLDCNFSLRFRKNLVS